MQTAAQLAREGEKFIAWPNTSAEIVETMKEMGFTFEGVQKFFRAQGFGECDFLVAIPPQNWSVKLDGCLYFALNEYGKARVCTDTSAGGKTCFMRC